MTEIAAVAGAAGSALLLSSRGPRAFVAGLVVVGGAAVGVAAGSIGGGALPVPSGGPALAGGLVLVAIAAGAAALFVRYPLAAVPALLLVAPLRLPIAADSSSPLLFEFVQSGGLGRLYPLYAVLVPVALAFAWRALRGAGFRPLPPWIAIPAAVLTFLAGASMLWTADVPATVDALVFFWLPFTLLLAVVAQTPVNAGLVRNLAIVLVGSAAVFAVIGLWQAATHQLFFYTPALELVNEHGPLFRVTSVFQDPSHFGRELVLGIAVVFVALWLDRLRLAWGVALVALMGAGLWFSYSQSSMVALVVVLLAVTLVAGDRASRRLTWGVCAALAVVAIGGFAYWVASGDIEDLTRERSRLVLDTGAVALDHPAGVGLGAQARVTQAEQNPAQDIPHNASHTTPMTVAAELGAAGLLAYLALLAGSAITLSRLRRYDETLAMGIGAVLVALFVHSIMYAGFFDNPIVWGGIGLAGGALAYYETRGESGERGMTLLGAAPIAASVAALGVVGLMNAAGRWVRVVSVALVLAGAAPLALLRLPGLMDWVAARPLPAAAGVLLALVLVAGAAAALVRVPWLVVVLALVAGLRIPLSPANPGPTNHLVVLWVLVGAGLLAFAWRARSDDWPRPRLGAVGWSLGAFVLLSAVSLFWSSVPEQGAYNFVAFYAPFGALAAMIGSIDVRIRLPEALGNTQVALGLLFALVALVQLATGDLFWNPDLIEGNLRSTYFRANSLFWDASALGRYEALAIITVLGALALGERRRSIGGAAVLCTVLFAGLQLSYSRAGLAALMLGVVLVAIAWRPRVAIPLGAAALAGVIAVLAVSGGVSVDRIFSGRSEILQQGVQIFEAAPIAGAGLGSYQSSHNVLLGIAAELGVIGLAVFLALAFAVAWAALRPADPARDRALRAVMAIELLVIFAHSMLDAALFDDGIAWALAAILAVIARPVEPPAGASVPARPAPVAAGPGAAAQP